jgi:hypothetical protein
VEDVRMARICITRFFTLAMILTFGVFITFTPQPAAAWGCEDMITEIQQWIDDQSSYYSGLRAELESIDPAEWTIEQHHTYLDASLWTIYYGIFLYHEEHGNLPSDVEGLAGTAYIPVWPGNPYNGWQPIQVLSLGDGFSPGDATLQICPFEYWSFVHNPRPASFELSIFGPDQQYGELGDAHPMNPNQWAVVPDGAVFMLGQYVETAAVSQQKFEELEQQGGEE